jgi:hypothetical protein
VAPPDQRDLKDRGVKRGHPASKGSWVYPGRRDPKDPLGHPDRRGWRDLRANVAPLEVGVPPTTTADGSQ